MTFGLICALAPAAFAQDTPPAAVIDDALAVPSVEAIDTPAEERLVELTVGFYAAIVTWNDAGERTCDQMWRPVRGYLDDHGEEIESAASELALRAEQMTDAEKTELAEYFALAMPLYPVVEDGQAVLYPCLRSGDVQGKGRPLDKEVRRFFRLQRPLIDAIVGNVD